MRSPSGKIVVFTALPLEYRAVRSHVVDLQRIDHEAGTIFEHGRIPGTNWEVYLTQVGQGNQGTAILTERAIQMIRPDAVFFTGIAGSMKDDLALGDVVVATRVFAYHGGKQESTFKTRPETWPASHRLEQAARFAALDPHWAHVLLPAGREAPEVHFKPIAAGEVVVNAGASALQDLLDGHYNGVAAIETEGAGFAGAASLADQVPALVIRGISDRADGSKQHTDAGGFQLIAADNAAALTIAVVKALPSPEVTTAKLLSSHSAVASPLTTALVGQQLKEPMPVAWRTELLPTRSMESATLEVHLIAEGSPRLPMRQMNQLKDKLVSLGRSEAFFTATEEVSGVLEDEFAAAYARDPRNGRNVGLMITRSGQRSCWESLPRSTSLHMPVLDSKHTQERVADLLRLLLRLSADVPPTRFAPALALDPAELLTVMSLDAARNSNSAALARSGRGGAVQITPDEVWDAANVDAAVPTIAEELTLRLMQHF
ncbi:5'-methylthioadenosine/S-adenosylhomocysteine nucleosidase [Streptomyces sp. BV129]|uniref:5'-methylthioadenosine/S-adenosylhomocysteine nucleosidase family protein n=1 Tax=Streptomyces sp. BV129 TaxID=2849671 RepID=UPI001C2E7DF7|nr:5'-methylthioadenosine/S-adenosylhomocysteine nucleosidase [Streptomyces sp. BV129]MBV1947012.1 5'-methylthioadenosine/S-adenosylhomocysteine nucleosidase [Streptomyces sp. BV129]